MSIYIAGPMSGRAKFNYPAFDAAAENLRDLGWEVISPAEMDDPEIRATALRSRTGNLKIFTDKTGETWGDFLSRDLKMIADTDIDAICLLPEWELSKGARTEVFVCMTLGYPVYFMQDDGVPLQLDYTRVLDDLKEGLLS